MRHLQMENFFKACDLIHDDVIIVHTYSRKMAGTIETKIRV